MCLQQSSTAEEAATWKKAISMQIESLINGTSSVRHFDASRLRSISPGSRFTTIEETDSEKKDDHGNSPLIVSHSPRPEYHRQKSDRKRLVSNGLSPLEKALRRLSGTSSPDPGRTESKSESSVPSQPRAKSASLDVARQLGYPPSTVFGLTEDEDQDARMNAAVQNLAEEPGREGGLKYSTSGACLSTTDAIQSVMARAGNDRCAECGSNNPKWASWNLGILICLECSGA